MNQVVFNHGFFCCIFIKKMIMFPFIYIVVPKGGLTNAEMAAVEYIRNVNPYDEVVKMSGGSSGELTLKGYHMHCLVPPLGDSGLSKWIYDEVSLFTK